MGDQPVIVNNDASIEGEDNLEMVHSRQVTPNINAARQPVEGEPVCCANATSKLHERDPAYGQGGYVETLLIKRPGSRNYIQSVMLCWPGSCRTCYPETATSQSILGGLPFIHSKNVFFSEGELRLRQERNELTNEGDPNMFINACEKKLITFDNPKDIPGYRRLSNPTRSYRVVTAVCVPTECSACIPGGIQPEPFAEVEPQQDLPQDGQAGSDAAPDLPENGQAGNDAEDGLGPIGYDDSGRALWVIDSIIDSRRLNGFEYRVHWEGFERRDATWEPLSNMALHLATLGNAIQRFHARHRGKPKPTAAQQREYGFTLPRRPARRRSGR